MGCAKRGEANGKPHWQASRQRRPPEKPRPLRVAAKCGACFVALLGIVAQATTFVARLAFIRILPATQSARDLFRGSLATGKLLPGLFETFVRDRDRRAQLLGE